MAIGEYLRVAAANLFRASVQRRQDADAKRNEVIHREQAARREIDNIREAIRRNQTVLSRNQLNPAQRTELNRQIQDFNTRISQIERRMRDERNQLLGISEALIQEARALESEASSLSNRAATAQS